jgi:hypothetical protein
MSNAIILVAPNEGDASTLPPRGTPLTSENPSGKKFQKPGISPKSPTDYDADPFIAK